MKNIIEEVKDTFEAKKKNKNLKEELSIRNETVKEMQISINKYKEEIKELKTTIKEKDMTNRSLRNDIKSLKKEIRKNPFDKKTCEDNMDKLNYLVCRCLDISFYSNTAVFQTKFDRGSNWRHPITTDYNNLENFQKDYLLLINDYIDKIRLFIENLYSEELEEYQKHCPVERDLKSPVADPTECCCKFDYSEDIQQ